MTGATLQPAFKSQHEQLAAPVSAPPDSQKTGTLQIVRRLLSTGAKKHLSLPHLALNLKTGKPAQKMQH
jgi:hypothetical protein